MRHRLSGLAAAMALLLLASGAAAFQRNEHADVAAAALQRAAAAAGGRAVGDTLLVLPDCAGDSLRVDLRKLAPWGFGAAVARAAADDGDPRRYHEGGRTPLQQLARLGAADLEADEAGGHNVVDSYWRRHHRALRRAAAGDLEGALEWEVQAQGFLHDAFASSHIEHPRGGWLGWIHADNTAHMHHVHRFTGAYLVDLEGALWEGFGEGLLDWYPQAREKVVAAAAAALQEVLTARCPDGPDASAPLLEIHDGPWYLETARARSLRLLPYPAVATISVREGEPDEHGIRPRRHWLQTAEAGAHDPDLPTVLRRRLPPAEAVPSWARLDRGPAEELIREDRDVAAPRFYQVLHVPPDFEGLQLFGGGGGDRGHGLWTAGVAWGLGDRLLTTRSLPTVQRPALELRLRGGGGARLLSGALSWQLEAPRLPGALHLEMGYGAGLDDDSDRGGPRLGVGLATGSVELPGIYLGGMARLRYEWTFLEDVVGGIFLEFVLH